uniref:Uncharacterized protein n=1 Tax=Ixodes ricinus TaxID=34613 RepID=A0A6B0UE36_IXORI
MLGLAELKLDTVVSNRLQTIQSITCSYLKKKIDYSIVFCFESNVTVDAYSSSFHHAMCRHVREDLDSYRVVTSTLTSGTRTTYFIAVAVTSVIR